LFRQFRLFIYEFVLSEKEVRSFFEEASSIDFQSKAADMIKNPYWPVAFNLFFSDSLLCAMFGPLAIQNAAPGSYPKYFQNQIENGFQKSDSRNNYFLHQIFLGYYLNRKEALPA
jgi:S-adenosylmethionine-diacylglycerol 3-amino-3-carboxypropyl transferase